jgi:hypothetical protein
VRRPRTNLEALALVIGIAIAYTLLSCFFSEFIPTAGR